MQRKQTAKLAEIQEFGSNWAKATGQSPAAKWIPIATPPIPDEIANRPIKLPPNYKKRWLEELRTIPTRPVPHDFKNKVFKPDFSMGQTSFFAAYDGDPIKLPRPAAVKPPQVQTVQRGIDWKTPSRVFLILFILAALVAIAAWMGFTTYN